MANYNYGKGGPGTYQEVLNKSWPPAEIASELKDRPDAIAVEVRVVFETDGEQWLDGMARRWRKQHVCVKCLDPRLRVPYVWVAASECADERLPRRCHDSGTTQYAPRQLRRCTCHVRSRTGQLAESLLEKGV